MSRPSPPRLVAPCALAAALVAAQVSFLAPAARAAEVPPSTTVGLTFGNESLSTAAPDWHEHAVSLRHAFGRRHALGGEIAGIERFGQRDTRFGIDYTLPYGEQLTLTVDAAASPTHRIAAKNALGGTAQYEFAPAWLVHAGLRSTGYNDVRVNGGLLGVERYTGNLGWAAFWRPSRAFGTAAHSAELRGSYYYGDRNSVGLIVAAGQEASNIGPGVVLTHFRSVALGGRHWLDAHWSVDYALSRTRLIDFYDRNGASVGVQYAF